MKKTVAKKTVTKKAATPATPVTKDSASKKPKRMAAHVSVNQNQAEPMHILGPKTKRPEVGDVLKVLPDRFQKTIFAKTVKVERITVEAGKTTIHATTF
jgi:hypothetical protein